MKGYYTLLVREDGSQWIPAFGDDERQSVIAERNTWRQAMRAKDLRIIKTGDCPKKKTGRRH